MGDESYGPRFVVVGHRSEKPNLPKTTLPKRTPSRLDNARRWAPAAYAKNHAEVNRRIKIEPKQEEFQDKELPPPPPERDYHESNKPFYI